MSLKDKASKINFANLPSAAPSPAPEVQAAPRPKTAPGLLMAQTVDQRSELLRDNDDLKSKVATLSDQAARAEEYREELKAWEGARATRMLDPKTVTWSAWANRNEANFVAADFEQFKEEIASAGGNVQAIKVRPLKPGGEQEYEVVFGHRRHRACLVLGLPVKAEIDSISDVELFVEMDRENRNRKNLSAWEQGRMYQQALDGGLFPSVRRLAESVGVDVSLVSKAVSLARLPHEVIEAFPSPLDLQFRWAKPLSDIHESDPAGLLARARKARGLGPERSASHVLSVLLDSAAAGVAQPSHEPVVFERGGKVAARLSFDSKGRAFVAFEPGAVTPGQVALLKSAVDSLLDKAMKGTR